MAFDPLSEREGKGRAGSLDLSGWRWVGLVTVSCGSSGCSSMRPWAVVVLVVSFTQRDGTYVRVLGWVGG